MFDANVTSLLIYVCLTQVYYVDLRYSGRQARANSIDPDQMPRSAASDQGQHCLPLIEEFQDTQKMDLLKF